MIKIGFSDIVKFTASLAVCFSAGYAGSTFSVPAVPTWYASLVKPNFNPPDWIFAPVWTLLYLLMAIALFIIWRKGIQDDKVRRAVMAFVLQLFLNALWSVVFFGLESISGGLIVIFALWASILFTMWLFNGISQLAYKLMVPYLIWVSFAITLNISLLILN